MSDAVVNILEGSDVKTGGATGVYIRDTNTGFWVPVTKELLRDVISSGENGELVQLFSGEIDTASDVETTLITFGVPDAKLAKVMFMMGTGNAAANFFLNINGSPVARFRTTAARLTEYIDSSFPIAVADENENISITCKRHSPSAIITMSANLILRLEDKF